MNKICLIHHFAGIGDILYLQAVAKKYISMGYEIIWPIRDDILWLGDYIPDIKFCSRDDDFPGKQYYGQDAVIITPNFVYLGIMRPHLWGIGSQKNTHDIMFSKYYVMNMDHLKWRDGFTFNRKLDKEDDLYYNILGLKDDDQFVFVNNLYNTDIRDSNLISKDQFDLPVVELKIIDGFTLFDWCKVLEKATEIHTVHTSINYVIDKLNIKAKKYFMYQGYGSSEIKHIPFYKKLTFVPN